MNFGVDQQWTNFFGLFLCQVMWWYKQKSYFESLNLNNMKYVKSKKSLVGPQVEFFQKIDNELFVRVFDFLILL